LGKGLEGENTEKKLRKKKGERIGKEKLSRGLSCENWVEGVSWDWGLKGMRDFRKGRSSFGSGGLSGLGNPS